jgi:F0F1-type ATP synthase assembly protein I
MSFMTGKKNAFYSQVKQLGVLTTIPILLLVGPLIGFLIGGWIDRKAHIYPWFTIIFVFLGFAASGREIFRLLKQILKENQSGK